MGRVGCAVVCVGVCERGPCACVAGGLWAFASAPYLLFICVAPSLFTCPEPPPSPTHLGCPAWLGMTTRVFHVGLVPLHPPPAPHP